MCHLKHGRVKLTSICRFLLSNEEAALKISKMNDQIQTSWYDTLRAHGVSERDAETVRGAFAYDGFD